MIQPELQITLVFLLQKPVINSGKNPTKTPAKSLKELWFRSKLVQKLATKNQGDRFH
jgi:hypothetical protein